MTREMENLKERLVKVLKKCDVLSAINEKLHATLDKRRMYCENDWKQHIEVWRGMERLLLILRI